jgi:hypothetical protein
MITKTKRAMASVIPALIKKIASTSMPDSFRTCANPVAPDWRGRRPVRGSAPRVRGRRARKSQQPEGSDSRHRLGALANDEFRNDTLDMRFYCLRWDLQDVGDALVGEALADYCIIVMSHSKCRRPVIREEQLSPHCRRKADGPKSTQSRRSGISQEFCDLKLIRVGVVERRRCAGYLALVEPSGGVRSRRRW